MTFNGGLFRVIRAEFFCRTTEMVENDAVIMLGCRALLAWTVGAGAGCPYVLTG
jgi:hypothetical protein